MTAIYHSSSLVYLTSQRQYILTLLLRLGISETQLAASQYFRSVCVSALTCPALPCPDLSQSPLQLENFSASKRSRLLARYKDMRKATAQEIRTMWISLGGFPRQGNNELNDLGTYV